jgi:hypothetical protein
LWVLSNNGWDTNEVLGNTWAGTRSFKEIFPTLYNITHYPHATVASVMSTIPINVSFRKALTREKIVDWHNLVTMISNFRLQEGNDRFNWNLRRDGTFSVCFMYLHRLDSFVPYRNKGIWKLKIPLKINFFLWLPNKRVILTKDNLVRKNWKDSQKCCFLIIMRRYNIFSLSVFVLGRFGT